MEKRIIKKIQSILTSKNWKKKYAIMICLLSIMVIFITTSALIVPAITMETDSKDVKTQEEIGESTQTEIENKEEVVKTETENTNEQELVEKTDTTEPSLEEAFIDQRVMGLSENALNVKQVTVGKVTTEGEALQAGEFTFDLYDGETLIDETTNDAEGNISFSIPISGPGIFQYTVVQKIGDRPNVFYDQSQYTINVAVEDHDVISTNFQSDFYYGLTVQSYYTTSDMTYRFYMSEKPGYQDYRVFCIDHSAKQTPYKATTEVYWVAEVDPSEEMLLACVCSANGYSSGAYYSTYNGWCDPLKENLKKLLYATTYGENKGMTDLAKQTLAWQMTQGIDSVSDNNYTIIKNIINQTVVPQGYQLVLFHPSDSTYQSFVMLMPNNQIENMKTETVSFKNEIAPLTGSFTAFITAQKRLDGESPGENMIFSFELVDENDNVLQKKQNDADGNIVFDPLIFTKAGTYHYTIREVNDHQSHIIYDSAPKSITIILTDQNIINNEQGKYESKDGVFNNRSNNDYSLPATGGTGIYLLTSIGLLLMIAATMLFIIKNKKKRRI